MARRQGQMSHGPGEDRASSAGTFDPSCLSRSGSRIDDRRRLACDNGTESKVILTERRQSRPRDAETATRTEVVAGVRSAARQIWREEIALGLLIDVTLEPAIIRLTGVLDRSTGSNLAPVVAECMAEGTLDFALDTIGLEIDPSGYEVLDRVRAVVHEHGGRLYVAADTEPAFARRPADLRGSA